MKLNEKKYIEGLKLCVKLCFFVTSNCKKDSLMRKYIFKGKATKMN
jgi:hypothetical protein